MRTVLYGLSWLSVLRPPFARRFRPIYHAMQMGSCVFDVVILVLSSSHFSRQNAAPVNLLKVAIGEFIVLLVVLVFGVI